MIEWYFVKTIEEVIGANPTLKKTKIQQEPTKAEIEVGCCSRNKDVLTNQKLSHLDSIEQRIVFTLKEKKKKEQRIKKRDLAPTTEIHICQQVRLNCAAKRELFSFPQAALKQLKNSQLHTL